MATIKRAISAKVNASGCAEILLRVSVSHSVSHRIKSGLYISADRFKDGKFTNPRDPVGKREVHKVQDKLESIEKFLIRLCEDNPVEKVTKDFVLAQLELFLNPPKEETVVVTGLIHSCARSILSTRSIRKFMMRFRLTLIPSERNLCHIQRSAILLSAYSD